MTKTQTSAGPAAGQRDVRSVIDLLGAEVIAVHGPLDRAFTKAVRFDDADGEAITFLKLTGPEATARIKASAAAVIISAETGGGPAESATVIVVAKPRQAFLRVVAALFQPVRPTGIHPSAIVDAQAVIDPRAFIGPGCVIGRCTIGPGTVVGANVTLYDGVRVGANVTINAGTVIGADGFGYERAADGTMEKFVHLGDVLIEDDVEIGSNTSIDRGTLGDTVIRRGAKIDNQVHVAHNCDIGEDAVIIAQSMIGGSVRLGARAWIAPGAVLMNGITVGADAVCGLGSVVTKAVPPGATVMGNPARPAAEAKALMAAQKKLITE